MFVYIEVNMLLLMLRALWFVLISFVSFDGINKLLI